MSLGRDAIFEPLYDRFPKQYGLSIHLEIQSIIFEGLAKHVTACINGNYLWKSFGYREVPLELQHGIRRDISALKNWFRSNESKRLESRRNRSDRGEQGRSSILAELGLHGLGQPVEYVAVLSATGLDHR